MDYHDNSSCSHLQETQENNVIIWDHDQTERHILCMSTTNSDYPYRQIISWLVTHYPFPSNDRRVRLSAILSAFLSLAGFLWEFPSGGKQRITEQDKSKGAATLTKYSQNRRSFLPQNQGTFGLIQRCHAKSPFTSGNHGEFPLGKCSYKSILVALVPLS